jgi:hypothetical protein
MKAKTKRSRAARGGKRAAARDLTTARADEAKGGIIAVLTGAKQQPGELSLFPGFMGGVTVASGDINGDSSAAKLKQ